MGPDLTRSASVTTNTEAMLAVCTSLASYARRPLLALNPHKPLRASVAALPLDASKTSRASHARIALRPYEGLDDDLNRPRGQPRRSRGSCHALKALWPSRPHCVAVCGLHDADVGNAGGKDGHA